MKYLKMSKKIIMKTKKQIELDSIAVSDILNMLSDRIQLHKLFEIVKEYPNDNELGQLIRQSVNLIDK